jgi:threonine aldolase
MANAEVGDDVYGDDPTVRALERATAELLEKEDAVYMPTGTMTNQVAIRTHTEAGDAVLFDQNAHVYILEGGAPLQVTADSVPLKWKIRVLATTAEVIAARRVVSMMLRSADRTEVL